MQHFEGMALHVELQTPPGKESEPGALVLNGERIEILGIDDRWYDADAIYYKVAAADGRVYLLCHASSGAWSILQTWTLDA